MSALSVSRTVVALILLAATVTSCSPDRQRNKAWRWPDQPLEEYLYKRLSDIPQNSPNDGITLDSIYQDVSRMIDPDSNVPLEVESEWVVVGMCGDHPTSSPELTALEASIIPQSLLTEDVKREAEKGKFLGPLNCKDGWTVVPSPSS